MAGKRIVPASVFLVVSALLLLLLGPGSGVKATNWDTFYTLNLSTTTPDTKADVTTIYDITIQNNNFAQIFSATGYPEANIVMDSDIADGSSVGMILNSTTLSIFNGPCSTPITVTIPFMDCTTETTKTAPWVLSGDNLVQDNDGDLNEDGSAAAQGTGNCIDGVDNDADTQADNNDVDCINEATDNNGLPTYCDHYPDFLNDMFSNVRPRARYMGHQVVVDDAPATMLDFVIFNPAALEGVLPTVVGQMGDTYGFIDFVVLDNPTQAVSPSTITDFCTPLQSIPTLYGTTDGSYTVTPGPEPYETDRTGQCLDATDNDGDTWVNDGCLVKSTAGPYYERSRNPGPLTGLFGTGTHVVRTYSQSQRDVDNDGVANNLDSCPYDPNDNVDADGDGLDSACDPNDAVASAGAPAGCAGTSGIPDEDQDCFPNRQDNCPLVPNGDPYDPVPSGKDQTDLDKPPGTAPADLGPNVDGIGEACDNNDTTPDGHFHVAMPITYACVPDPNGGDDWDGNGDADNDDDGVCDSTEILLGSDPEDDASTPEHLALDLAIGTGTAAEAPGTCADFTTYNHPDSPAGGVDNDGDGDANGADSDCSSPADTDQDLVDDAADNCPTDKNPEQVDSDGDGAGDECDDDDDGDGVNDDKEGCKATLQPEIQDLDPKHYDADKFYDFDGNTVIDVTDALIFLPKFPSAVGSPADEKYNYDCNGVIDVTDALIFLAKFPSDTASGVTLVNNTGQAVNGVHIEFFSAITQIKSGGGWASTTTLPSSSIDLDGGDLANGGSLVLALVGKRPPVVKCYDWTDDPDGAGAQPRVVVNGSPQPCRIKTNPPYDGIHFRTSVATTWSIVQNQAEGLSPSLNLTVPVPDQTADRWHTLYKDVPLPNILYVDADSPIVSVAYGEHNTTSGDGGTWDPAVSLVSNPPHTAEMYLPGGAAVNCGNGVNDDAASDGFIDDGCPAVAGGGELDPCWNNDDDDGDTTVNDGCPQVGPAPEVVCGEPHPQPLVWPADNDFDGWINDGCAAVGPDDDGDTQPDPETALDECANALDDDGDTVANDGCPPRPTP